MPIDNVPLRPAWVEVNLNAIEQNTRRLGEIARPAEVMAMVKANGYGHGAVEASRAALRGGATWLGVYSVGEGIELRRAGIDAPILVVGPTPPRWACVAVEHRLTLTVFSMETVAAIADAARVCNRRAQVHIKIDTGMTRLGVMPEEAVNFARAVSDLVELEGAFTHFSMADTPDAYGEEGWGRAYTRQQLARFGETLDALDQAGIVLRYRHVANSPATLNLPEARFNLVRSGILIYGLDPSPEVPRPSGFVPALAFKTEVALVKSVPAGKYVGYGATFRTTRPTRLAVLMVGYADGFRRAPRHYGEVLVRGQRAPIAGRVCMDQTMVDVTDIEGVQPGDEVVLIGRQGPEEICAEEVAEKLGANNYETITTISARVERRYVSEG
ncbi:MAG: alanine racemase [Chloroflexi bacterium]|nr:alanine racemase [Chloroflexota bacterium]